MTVRIKDLVAQLLELDQEKPVFIAEVTDDGLVPRGINVLDGYQWNENIDYLGYGMDHNDPKWEPSIDVVVLKAR